LPQEFAKRRIARKACAMRRNTAIELKKFSGSGAGSNNLPPEVLDD
jgi:hypothetical protein